MCSKVYKTKEKLGLFFVKALIDSNNKIICILRVAQVIYYLYRLLIGIPIRYITCIVKPN